jgi:ABC-type nitrate/sulfonate/bicarbonate transport system substrate-binding protein
MGHHSKTSSVHHPSALSQRIISILVLLLLWSSTAHGAESPLPLFRLGYSGAGIAQNLTQVIDKSGVWTKHNIDVRSIYFTSGTIMAQALVGGDIDVTDSNIPTMLNLKAAGLLDVKIVAVWMNKILLSFIARNPIKSPAELKGKKLGISRFGSSSDFITRLLIRYWKLDPEKDITIIQAGGNDSVRMAALIGGHLDGALIGSHDVPKLLESGCCNNLANLEELPIDYSRFGIAMPASVIKSRRDHVRRYLQALTEGIYVYRTRPELPIALLKREGVKEADLAYQKIIKALIEYPVPDEKGIQVSLESIGTPKSKQAQAKDFVDASIMEEIKKSGFIDRLYGR